MWVPFRRPSPRMAAPDPAMVPGGSPAESRKGQSTGGRGTLLHLCASLGCCRGSVCGAGLLPCAPLEDDGRRGGSQVRHRARCQTPGSCDGADLGLLGQLTAGERAGQLQASGSVSPSLWTVGLTTASSLGIAVGEVKACRCGACVWTGAASFLHRAHPTLPEDGPEACATPFSGPTREGHSAPRAGAKRGTGRLRILLQFPETRGWNHQPDTPRPPSQHCLLCGAGCLQVSPLGPERGPWGRPAVDMSQGALAGSLLRGNQTHRVEP